MQDQSSLEHDSERRYKWGSMQCFGPSLSFSDMMTKIANNNIVVTMCQVTF